MKAPFSIHQIKVKESAGMTMLTGRQIDKFRLITLEKGIKLEGKGISMSRGRSCLAIVKAEFGWKGNRVSILARLRDHIDSMPDSP
jgi:hypothetical protein